MAKLDDLIKQVKDQRLRSQLKDAAMKLQERKRFGLVFEEHIPETTLLLDYPIKEGANVYIKSDTTLKNPLKVASIKGDNAVVIDRRGEESKVKLGDLLIYKSFGEPIYAALSLDEQLSNSEERPYHTVINGENFHALQLLQYTHEGKVDCVYIDPPYNTGDRSWKYNNNYVDKNDRWRHSKWLSFMEKRLRLAKRLLKSDGVLIVTIDEHEVHQGR
jgi:adenine-specific DNA-methyltransferase